MGTSATSIAATATAGPAAFPPFPVRSSAAPTRNAHTDQTTSTPMPRSTQPPAVTRCSLGGLHERRRHHGTPSPPRARGSTDHARAIGAAPRARRNIPKQEGRARRIQVAGASTRKDSAGTANGRRPDMRRGPLGVSVRGALPCSQVFRHRRTGDRRRADGAATSRHPVRRRRGHPEGLRHRRPAAGGTTASYLPVLDVPRVVIRGSSCCHDDVVVRSPVGPTSTACPHRRHLPEGRSAPPARVPEGARASRFRPCPSGRRPGPRDLRRGHLTCGFSLPGRDPSPAVLDLSISM